MAGIEAYDPAYYKWGVMGKKTQRMLTITEAHDEIAKEEREADAKWEQRALNAEDDLRHAKAEAYVNAMEACGLRDMAIDDHAKVMHLVGLGAKRCEECESETRREVEKQKREIARLKKQLAKCLPKGGIEAKP